MSAQTGTGSVFSIFKFPNIKDIKSLIACFSIIEGFYPFLDAKSLPVIFFDKFNLFFCVAVALVVSLWIINAAKFFKKDATLTLMIYLMLLLTLLSPQYIAGIIGPGARFIYPAIWFIFACLGSLPVITQSVLEKWLKPLSIAVFLVQIIFLHLFAGRVSGKMEDVYRNIQIQTQKADFAWITENRFNYENTTYRSEYIRTPFLRMTSPLERLPFYLRIENYRYNPIFTTGMFHDKTPPLIASSVSILKANVSRYPEKLLILGHQKGNDFISTLMKDNYTQAYRDTFLTVMIKRK